MTDAVTSRVLLDGPVNHIVHLTNISDSTGESAVTKVDVSGLSNVDYGVACAEVAIRKIKYRTHGMGVELYWDASADAIAAILPADAIDTVCYDPPLVNPKATGWTGDVKLTTVGHDTAVNGSYDILLELEKRG